MEVVSQVTKGFLVLRLIVGTAKSNGPQDAQGFQRPKVLETCFVSAARAVDRRCLVAIFFAQMFAVGFGTDAQYQISYLKFGGTEQVLLVRATSSRARSATSFAMASLIFSSRCFASVSWSGAAPQIRN